MTDPQSESSFEHTQSESGPEPPASNPYRSPESQENSNANVFERKLTVVDWVLACLLGLVAAVFVFPSTCLGALVLFQGAGGGPGIMLVFSISGIFAIAAAVYSGWLVLRARSK